MELGGTFAGRFGIEAEAGAGSMGVVYRARDLRTGELVALKVLRGFSDAAPRARSRARVGRRAARALPVSVPVSVPVRA